MIKSLREWWRSRSDAEVSLEAEPSDKTRIYAVGDIHGRADLLGKMHDLIAEDLNRNPCNFTIEIYIGDYVDRGPDSYSVMETLSSSAPLCSRRVCLMGNHEQIFLGFLSDPQVILSWMSLGGLETLLSYGVRARLNPRSSEIGDIHADLLLRLPTSHKSFLEQLQMSFTFGKYFFVHAGVRPGVGLTDQKPVDLLWIREPFLSSMKNFGAVVVHGHTPGETPVELPNRICIDTGAYVTGKLTCLVLEGGQRRFLSASVKDKSV